MSIDVLNLNLRKINFYTLTSNDLRGQNLWFRKAQDPQLVSNTKLQEGRLKLILYI